jgi:hypothetical protein
MEILHAGANHHYPINKVMLEYMQLFAKYSRVLVLKALLCI